MRRFTSIELPLFALLFLVLGLRGLTNGSWPALLLGIAALAVSAGLWRRRSALTTRAYACFAAILLVAAAWRDLGDGEHPLAVGTMLLLIGTIYGAFGLYLRSVVGRERQGEAGATPQAG
jgi:hypothetical protein